jgi:8-oxo-dGTP diphosphatase
LSGLRSFLFGAVKMEHSDCVTSREYPSSPLVGVGAVITSGGSVLLIRRGKEPSRGEWSIPGGLVRVGETLKEAVARESAEETGLIVRPDELVELLERIFHDDRGRVRYHYVLADYRCQVVGGQLAAGSDALEAQWVEHDRLERMGLARVTLNVIRKAMDARGTEGYHARGGNHAR